MTNYSLHLHVFFSMNGIYTYRILWLILAMWKLPYCLVDLLIAKFFMKNMHSIHEIIGNLSLNNVKLIITMIIHLKYIDCWTSICKNEIWKRWLPIKIDFTIGKHFRSYLKLSKLWRVFKFTVGLVEEKYHSWNNSHYRPIINYEKKFYQYLRRITLIRSFIMRVL